MCNGQKYVCTATVTAGVDVIVRQYQQRQNNNNANVDNVRNGCMYLYAINDNLHIKNEYRTWNNKSSESKNTPTHTSIE